MRERGKHREIHAQHIPRMGYLYFIVHAFVGILFANVQDQTNGHKQNSTDKYEQMTTTTTTIVNENKCIQKKRKEKTHDEECMQ